MDGHRPFCRVSDLSRNSTGGMSSMGAWWRKEEDRTQLTKVCLEGEKTWQENRYNRKKQENKKEAIDRWDG